MPKDHLQKDINAMETPKAMSEKGKNENVTDQKMIQDEKIRDNRIYNKKIHNNKMQNGKVQDGKIQTGEKEKSLKGAEETASAESAAGTVSSDIPAGYVLTNSSQDSVLADHRIAEPDKAEAVADREEDCRTKKAGESCSSRLNEEQADKTIILKEKEEKQPQKELHNQEAPKIRNHSSKNKDTDKGRQKKSPGKGRMLNIFLGILGVLFILAGVAYLIVAMYFRSHFLPNTNLNGIDCSYRDTAEAARLLEEQSRQYVLDILDQDGSSVGIVQAADIDLKIDVTKDVETILDQQNAFEWLFVLNNESSHNLVYGVTFDENKLVSLLEQFPAFMQENMELPQNAYIGEYSELLKAYEIVPETRGSILDMNKVGEALFMAVQTGDTKLELEQAGCYVRAEITSEDVNLQQKLDTMNSWAGARITYDWNGSQVILDGDIIHQWIITDEGNLSLDEEAAAEFVAVQAKEHDTYGKKRRFTTTAGQELTLPSGAYGWKTDRKKETQELLELVREGSITEREPVYSMKGFQKGSNDIGNSYVEIDLTNQHLYLYIDGEIVMESDFVSGDMTKSGRMTPPGVFGLTYKTTKATLKGEDYETPVNYWMPFNGNIGMHDATWRRKFGGEVYITNGSHGCINLPLNNAKEIYSYISTGFPVICYYY